MATETYDAVIIGSGHNGLIVGNYLAMAGLSVCVLEAKNVIGGCTATVECTLPGFKHDIGSVALGAIQSNPVYADDELGIREKYGFEFIDTKKNGATLYPDGTGVLEDAIWPRAGADRRRTLPRTPKPTGSSSRRRRVFFR